MERIDRLEDRIGSIQEQDQRSITISDFDEGWNRALEVLAVTSEEVLNPMSAKNIRMRQV